MGLSSILKISRLYNSDKIDRFDKEKGGGPGDRTPKIQRTVEIITLILLASATVTSAWCVYEATAWGNVQMATVGSLVLLQAESIRLTDNDNSVRTIDVNLFLSWVQAASEKQSVRMAFLEDRFREEFRPAFQEWVNSGTPGEIPEGTPFSLKSYSPATTRQLEQVKANITEQLDDVRQANRNSDSYVLTTVFSALVLFFAGVAGKWKWQLITSLFIGIAILLMLIVLQRIFTLPVIIT